VLWVEWRWRTSQRRRRSSRIPHIPPAPAAFESEGWQVVVVEVPKRARVPERRHEDDQGAPRQGQGPAREPPRADDGHLGREGSVQEASGERMDRDPRVELRLNAVGEGAVISDRQGQEEGRYPDGAMDVWDRRPRRPDSGEPPEDSQPQPDAPRRAPAHRLRART
jgi:hypothetical protein